VEIPEQLRYAENHEWARVEGDLIRVGITDYAQDALGDIVYVELPEAGRELAAGESFGEIESTKSVSDVYAPVAGTVAEVNQALDDNPEIINSDPYGDGWMLLLAPAEGASLDALMDAAAYAAFIED
jgi:glycine cleavage system H protein